MQYVKNRFEFAEKRSAISINLRTMLLYLILFFMPVERFATFDIMGGVIRPVYIFMFMFIILSLKDTKIRKDLILFSLLVILSSMISGFAIIGIGEWIFHVAWTAFTLLFTVLLIGYLSEKKLAENYINLYIKTASFWSFVVLIQWMASFFYKSLAYSWLSGFPRVQGPMYEPSFLPIYLLPVVILCVSKKYWGLSILSVTALLLSSSRTGLLGLAALVLLGFIFGDRKLRKYMANFIIAITILISMALIFSPGKKFLSVFTNFVGGAISLTDTSSTLPRLDSWKVAWEVFLQSPYVGVGMGRYGEEALSLGYSDPTHAKQFKTTNLYLEVLAEMGIQGEMIFIAWCLFIFIFLVRSPKNTIILGLIISWVTLFILFLLIQTWWRPYLWNFMAISIAYAIQTRSQRKLNRSMIIDVV